MPELHECQALIIEDNPGDTKVLQTLLARIGIAFVALDGLDVLGALQEIPIPDLVFLDLDLPEMDGFEVLEELNAISEFQDVPVVAYTSHTSEMAYANRAGFHSFLGKPLNSAEFGDQVARIINGESVWEVRE